MPKKIDNNATREKLVAIQKELTVLHLGKEMKEIIECGVALILGSGHMLIYGPPGANKTNVIEDLCLRFPDA
ncbi:unnamed protein product, partial [marine sediment metagenome]